MILCHVLLAQLSAQLGKGSHGSGARGCLASTWHQWMSRARCSTCGHRLQAGTAVLQGLPHPVQPWGCMHGLTVEAPLHSPAPPHAWACMPLSSPWVAWVHMRIGCAHVCTARLISWVGQGPQIGWGQRAHWLTKVFQGVCRCLLCRCSCFGMLAAEVLRQSSHPCRG